MPDIGWAQTMVVHHHRAPGAQRMCAIVHPVHHGARTFWTTNVPLYPVHDGAELLCTTNAHWYTTTRCNLGWHRPLKRSC